MGIEAWRLLDPYLDDVDDLRERIAAAFKEHGLGSRLVLLFSEENSQGEVRPLREWAAIRGDCSDWEVMRADFETSDTYLIALLTKGGGGRIVWLRFRWFGCGPEQFN
jgi:hypothetical protein